MIRTLNAIRFKIPAPIPLIFLCFRTELTTKTVLHHLQNGFYECVPLGRFELQTKRISSRQDYVLNVNFELEYLHVLLAYPSCDSNCRLLGNELDELDLTKTDF